MAAAIDSIGLCECTSIAIGHKVQDQMLKAADVELLLARTICSGKYLVVVGGEVSAVTAAVTAGVEAADESLIEERVIPRVHPQVFPALSAQVTLDPQEAQALGIVETFSASSIIDCADAAAKAGNVQLFRVHIAMAIGGKGYLLVTGEIGAVEAAVAAGAAVAAAAGILVSEIVIPGPREELFREFV